MGLQAMSDHPCVDQRFVDLEKLMEARFTAAALAVDLAKHAIDAKFENTNEWRRQLDREREEFAKSGDIKILAGDIKRNGEAIAIDIQRHGEWMARMDGGLNLLRFMGFAGLIALLVELFRLFKAT